MSKKARIIGLCIIVAIALMLTSCGKKMPYSDLDLNEYLDVGKYKGIKTEKAEVSIQKSDVADQILKELNNSASSRELSKGEAVKDRDTVNISYVGKIDGKKFDGGTADNQDLQLGSGTYIDGFESGLVGHTVGEKNIKLNLAFPLNYQNEDLSGKDVVFIVKINSATREEQPEYNDKYVQSLGDYKTTAEYEKAVEKAVYKEKKDEAEQSQRNDVWSQALANTEVKKYPQDMIDHYMKTFDEQIDYYAEQANTDRRTIMSQYFGASSEASLQKQFKDYAQMLVKQEMLVEYIAQKENIKYSAKEAENFEQEIISQGYTEDSVKLETGRSMEEYVHISLLYEKVQKFLVKNAKIK